MEKGRWNYMSMLSFGKRELISGSKLTRWSQRDLVEAMRENKRLGIIIGDNLEYGLYPIDQLEEIARKADLYDQLIEQMEEQRFAQELQLETRLNASTEKWQEVPEQQSLMDFYKKSKGE